MADVFISYAREDEASARRVASALRAHGLDVWVDDQLPAHRAYSDVIEQQLRDAKAVIVLWSEHSARSQWVRAEAEYARGEGKLAQAQLDGGLPPMPFNQIQSASLMGWRGRQKHSGWRTLLASVEALVSGEEPRETRAVDAQRAASRRWPRWVAAAALLLVAMAVALRMVFGDGDGDQHVVAVLPFESLDQRDSSLASGIWEDTRQAIGRNPQLLVLGPNTSQELVDRGAKAARRAADYLVEGSVRSADDRIRVSVNLVRSRDGAQMWSETFERRLDDVFVLQNQIAQEIEGRIRGRLARGGGKLPENIATSGEVYALYSDARAKIRARRPEHYQEALAQLRQVVQADPNFAPGWATLSVAIAFGLDQAAVQADAEQHARRAIALAPNLAAGHAALGFAIRRGPAAQASLRRALALDPNDVEALHWLANSLGTDEVDEKLRLYSRIVEIEPLWWPAIVNKLNLLADAGGAEAIEEELTRLEKAGDERLATAAKLVVLNKKGDLSAAVDLGLGYYRRASAADREFILFFLLQPLYQLGQFEIADRLSPPISDFVPLIRLNDPRFMDVIEARMQPRQFWTFGLLGSVGPRVYLLNNQGPRLAKIYRAAVSSPEEFEALVGEPFKVVAPGAALALRSAGDEDQAKKLLDRAEVLLRDNAVGDADRSYLARVYAAQGRKDEAIAILTSLVRAGWLPPHLPIQVDLALDPAFRELRSDPRFEPLRQQILGHLRKERAELGDISFDDLRPTPARAS